jgi:hypothetical protein
MIKHNKMGLNMNLTKNYKILMKNNNKIIHPFIRNKFCKQVFKTNFFKKKIINNLKIKIYKK